MIVYAHTAERLTMSWPTLPPRPWLFNHSSIHTKLTQNYVKEERMSTIEKSIEVNVPVYTAYSQWTHFEEFPQFMEGVKEVKQLDVKRLHWKTEIAGQDKEWDAEITESR